MISTNHGRAWFWTGVCILLLLLMAGLTAFLSGEPNFQFVSSVVALSAIGAVAVGIERVIEAFWSFMGVIGKDQWPLGSLYEKEQELVTNLDAKLIPFYHEAGQAIDKVSKASHWTKDQQNAAWDELGKLKGDLENLKNNGLYNSEFRNMATAALQGVTSLQQKYPDLKNAADVANQAVKSAADFVDSFKENPGRRLISIYFCMLLGMGVSWIMGLDMFQAVFAGSAAVGNAAGPHWGIALTGMIMGLGASPTHEVIQILQEIKLNRQADNRQA